MFGRDSQGAAGDDQFQKLFCVYLCSRLHGSGNKAPVEEGPDGVAGMELLNGNRAFGSQDRSALGEAAAASARQDFARRQGKKKHEQNTKPFQLAFSIGDLPS
jgi:hypothetical protein